MLALGQSHFTRVTDGDNPAVNFAGTPLLYKGVAWVDLDDDTWPDLFVGPRFVFRNEGQGKFTTAAQLPVSPMPLGGGVSFGDIDRDGRIDCIAGQRVSNLYYGKDSFRFENATAILPDFANYAAWDCALADVNNDGWLDLTFAHAVGFHPPNMSTFPCRLYLAQAGGKTFEKVSGYEFTDQLAPYTIPVWSDYDLDGDLDLFVGSGPGGSLGPDFVYKNLLKESNTFGLQRLKEGPFAALQDGQVYGLVDYDNDGDKDICLTNYGGAPNRFWVRKADGTYDTLATPFTKLARHLANAWGDFDNDGDLDVLITWDNGTEARLFRNNGKGNFDEAVIAGAIPSDGSNSFSGIALADYDNDGDLDFYTNGATSGRAMFRNDTLASNRKWAHFTLRGQKSNGSGIGALIRVKATIGKPVWQMREVLARNSFQSQSDLRQHFGLGDATKIDSLEIRWPSGIKDGYKDLPVNSFWIVNEEKGLVLPATGGRMFSEQIDIMPNPFHDAFTIGFSNKDEVQIKKIECFDTAGRQVSMAFKQEGYVWIAQAPAQLLPGLYILRLTHADGRVSLVKVMRG
jgi:enediyne biosynthesis protein E4